MKAQQLTDRLRGFPDFAKLPDETGAELQEKVSITCVSAHETLAAQGEPCLYFPVVLSGQARIFAMDEDGREITLYRLDPGEGCVLAAACSLSEEPMPGSVTVEAAGEGLFIPAALFRAWVERHTFWREYVFRLIAHQLGRVVAITNELAFRRLDTRIAALLVRQGTLNQRLELTHQAVALELGTRREVVSRILKGFEQDGLVKLERGVIQLRDHPGLTKRAGLGSFGDISN